MTVKTDSKKTFKSTVRFWIAPIPRIIQPMENLENKGEPIKKVYRRAKYRGGVTMYTLWSSPGRIEDFKNKEGAIKAAKEWWEKYQEQKITVSWLEDRKQKDQVLFYDGEDQQLAEGWLNLHRMVKCIERRNRDGL